MKRKILITINGELISYNRFEHEPYIIKEVDKIVICIETEINESPPIFYFEDYQCTAIKKIDDEIHFYETPESRYFSECFGYATIRIEFDNERIIIPFEVQVKKTSAEQAKKMIAYLATHNDTLIKSCFSRSSLTVGSNKSDFIDPETILTSAEKFIETLESFQLELTGNLRKRLIPMRVPIWETNRFNCEIDPYDVINNLDALTPSVSSGDVYLRGRNFDLSGIYVSSIQPTANVLENQIILGGLYSIRRQINFLSDQLYSLGSGDKLYQHDYESFNRLMLSITSGGMIKRCEYIINSTNRFIKLFENKFGVQFLGEIIPLMTAYARGTRIYRMLFTQLNLWYQLGTPSIGGINFLMKLKSLSKIYEIFVLFHILEELYRQGWSIESATKHETMGDYIPSKVYLKLGNNRITIFYEKIVNILDKNTAHMDLIDIGHNSHSLHPYWMPDFIVKFESRENVRYLIFDAKYSTRSNVKEYHIPSLFEKYYVAMAAYDAINATVTHTPIIGVFAVYSLDDRPSNYISKWGRHGINQQFPMIPMIGGIGLMTDNTNLFNELLSKSLEILQKTIPISSENRIPQ